MGRILDPHSIPQVGTGHRRQHQTHRHKHPHHALALDSAADAQLWLLVLAAVVIRHGSDQEVVQDHVAFDAVDAQGRDHVHVKQDGAHDLGDRVGDTCSDLGSHVTLSEEDDVVPSQGRTCRVGCDHVARVCHGDRVIHVDHRVDHAGRDELDVGLHDHTSHLRIHRLTFRIGIRMLLVDSSFSGHPS